MKSKNLTLASLFAGLFMFMNPMGSEACTRAVYLGPDDMVVTGRTMDWKEDPQSNLYLFPQGVQRRGAISDNTIQWTSKYGSVVTAGYDIGTCDGMNEKGLVANLLFLTESSYFRPDDNRPVMGLSIWTQYVLDNFATVDEAVAELSKEVFRIDDPDLPNGAKSTLHLSISDASGNSAIFEYLNGNLVIHEGRECQVMTNSPTYDKQLTLNDYWQQIGGLVMLPGTNRASDRFVRASFYIHTIPQTSNFREAVAGVFSVMRNVSVPLGITTPDQPNISSTRWRTVADQKNKVYYFESTLSPDIFWVDFKSLDFKAGTPIKKLTLTNGEITPETPPKISRTASRYRSCSGSEGPISTSLPDAVHGIRAGSPVVLDRNREQRDDRNGKESQEENPPMERSLQGEILLPALNAVPSDR